MKTKFSSIFWGLALILVGGFLLGLQLGYFQDLAEQTWMLIFAAASVLFFATYFVNGIQAWGWLFPACIFAALSGTLYIVDTSTPDEWIATLIVGSVAIPFIVAYFLDRSRWALLIPAFILSFVAFIPPLSQILRGEVMGSFIVGMIGLPFLVTYLASPKNWWAIIPGGTMLSIAVMIALTSVRLGFDAGSFAVGVMFLGWALTFALLWLRRTQGAFEWAKYPAIALGIVACIMFLITSGLEIFWSLGLIIAGLVIIYFNLRPRGERTGS